ncbi:MAG: hypothetical protein JNL80_05020 [Phycisphaerae bacterium]|nr:hypothetical protein [Phycisphaerae bacterium]
MARLRALAGTVGWGLFCTSSWTWCIGMYLPIILVRHWGWPGFWVFAILNVLGCAGFGYWCSRERSERLCREHAGAMVLFSGVTIAYQVFFVVFLGAWAADRANVALGNGPPVEWMAAAGAIVGGLLLSLAPNRTWPWLGALATVVSYATWYLLGTGRLAGAPAAGTESTTSLVLAAPIIGFGFLLCPWLDATFHRARQQAPSHHAFGVFGATFLPVILMTVAYGASGSLDPTAPILTHLSVQLLFTIAVHVREVRVAPVPQSNKARQLALLAPTLGGVAVAYLGSLSIGFEPAYLYLLGFYGLIFPTYVLLFMGVPALSALGLGPWPRTPRTVGLAALLVLALSPLCAAGFVELKTWLLTLAFGVILVAAVIGRLMTRRGGTDAADLPSRANSTN